MQFVGKRFGVMALGALVAFTMLMSMSALAGSVDVNQASAQQLTTVNGIGQVTAERIVQERARGFYESMAHLSERLAGIGPKRLAKLERAGLCAGTPQKSCASADASPLAAGVTTQSKTPASEGVTPIVINLP